jgi:hypothetical protein
MAGVMNGFTNNKNVGHLLRMAYRAAMWRRARAKNEHDRQYYDGKADLCEELATQFEIELIKDLA